MHFDRSNMTNLFQEIHLPGLIQMLFQFRRRIEMIFEGSLRMTRNNKDLFNPARFDFFDNILNRRLIYDRKHFLRHRLRLRKESCTKSRCRADELHFCERSEVGLFSICEARNGVDLAPPGEGVRLQISVA